MKVKLIKSGSSPYETIRIIDVPESPNKGEIIVIKNEGDEFVTKYMVDEKRYLMVINEWTVILFVRETKL